MSSQQTVQLELTIAMPVFNAGDHLSLAVMSVINQSFQNWELFVVDDGSTDDCIAALGWVTDKRVFIIKNHDNKGLAYRLNEIIEIARGDYFVRMDQDDVCHPLRLEKQLNFLKHHDSFSLIGTKCAAIDQNNHYLCELSGIFDQADITLRPWHEIRIAHPTWFGKISWFKRHKYKYPASYLSEDQELLLRAKNVSKYYVLSESLLAYRVGRYVKFIKKYNTRLSLMKVKSVYFINNKEHVNFMLSIIVFIASVIKDGVDAVFPFSHYVMQFKNKSSSFLEQKIYWENLIEKYLEEISNRQIKSKQKNIINNQ